MIFFFSDEPSPRGVGEKLQQTPEESSELSKLSENNNPFLSPISEEKNTKKKLSRTEQLHAQDSDHSPNTKRRTSKANDGETPVLFFSGSLCESKEKEEKQKKKNRRKNERTHLSIAMQL